jgi:hypothetical protein
MVHWEGELIKVLVWGHKRRDVGNMRKARVCGFYQLAKGAKWVVVLGMEV